MTCKSLRNFFLVVFSIIALAIAPAGRAFAGGSYSVGSKPLSVGNTIFVDAVFGNDASGVRGKKTSPFLTLRGAIAAAGITAGDVIQLGPGTFTETTAGNGTGIRLPSGVSVRGAGINNTTVVNDIPVAVGGSQVANFNPGSNSKWCDLSLTGHTSSNVINMFFGYNGNSTNPDTTFTNVILRRVQMTCWSDSIYIQFPNAAGPFSAINMQCFDCIFNSGFDCINLVSGRANTSCTSLLAFWHCTFNVTDYGFAVSQQWSGCKITAASTGNITYKCYGCEFNINGGNSTSNITEAISASGNSTGDVELYGCNVTNVSVTSGTNMFCVKMGANIPIIFGGGTRYDPTKVGLTLGSNATFSGGQTQLVGIGASNLLPQSVTVGALNIPLRAGGTLFNHFTQVQTSTSSTEQDLFTDTTAANTFSFDGDTLNFEYSGTFSATATATKRVRVYAFGSLIYDSGVLTSNAAGAFTIRGRITGAATQSGGPGAETADCAVTFSVAGTTTTPAATTHTALSALDFTAATNIVKCTGLPAGSGLVTGDITATSGQVVLKPAI